MDFLGLRTLTVIKDAADLVYKNHGIKIDVNHIDYNDHTDPDAVLIDYNDKKVLDYIGTGRTEGVFQLESAGMKNFMKELKPQSLEDVIAGISLYRPGPMDFIPKYIKGKNERDSITYECKELEPILEPTYGCIVYQEQVMQIVQELAGYTMGQADNIRRAMSKKKQYVIDAERQNLFTATGNRASEAVLQTVSASRQRIRSTIPWWILQNMHLINHMQRLMQWFPTRQRILNITIR